MIFKDKVKTGIMTCIRIDLSKFCSDCPYNRNENGEVRDARECKRELWYDFNLLISDMENVIKLLEEKS